MSDPAELARRLTPAQRKARIRHEHFLHMNEGMEWSSLHGEAQRLDAARQAITARVNILRMRACQRALFASRKAVRADVEKMEKKDG